MKVVEVKVFAGRVFSHPYESYSNLRPSVFMTATLEDGDDPGEAVRTLQARAEHLVEDHKQHLLSSIERLHEMDHAAREIGGLEARIREAQDRLAGLREKFPEIDDTAGKE